MGKAISFLIFSVISFYIAYLAKSLLTIDMSGIETTGIIKKVFDDDGGNVTYYVDFQDGNGTVRGESIPYSWKTKTLGTGEIVKIIYRNTKSPRPTVLILDERVKPCGDSLLPLSRVFSVISVICFIIAIVFLLKRLRS